MASPTAEEELARLRREKAELARQHAREKAAWDKKRRSWRTSVMSSSVQWSCG